VRYYCPNCWKDFWDDDFEICPECGYNIKTYNDNEYVDKLLGALNHPAGEIRHWAVMVLELRKEKKALPYLIVIAETSDDLGLKRAAAEAIERIGKA